MKMPKNWKNKSFAIVGITLFFFGLWQMDVISIPRIWNGIAENMPYEMGRIGNYAIVTSTGTGYDLMQAFIVIGFIFSILSLWFWDE